jgi:hypothetical protein
MLRAEYSLMEWMGVYAHVGIASSSSSVLTYTGAGVTNANSLATALDVPIYAGISLIPASAFNLNLGIGYVVRLNNAANDYTVAGTNVTTTGSTLQGVYNFFNEHYYQKPFIKVEAKGKFAGDWEAGLMFVTALWAPLNTADNNLSVNTANKLGHTITGPLFSFSSFQGTDPFGDQRCYIKYSKDAFEMTGAFGAKDSSDIAGQQVGGGTGLFGIFGYVDFGVKF